MAEIATFYICRSVQFLDLPWSSLCSVEVRRLDESRNIYTGFYQGHAKLKVYA